MTDLSPELSGYRIVGRLAVGGMAEVYQAQALESAPRGPGEPDEVVVKRLLPGLREDNAAVKQFVDEAKLTARLRHPNIVRTFRCFRSGADYLMVQELVQGRTLAFMLDAFIEAGQPMPPSAATFIVSSVLRALDYVHRARVGEAGANIVHRDVNPANVLLSVKGEVKLTDFGVAEVEGVMQGQAGALRGTLAYMSPEQVLGHPVDPRSDLFSVGVMLWELYANRRLFVGGSEVELMHRVRDAQVPRLQGIVPELPDFAARIVRRALLAPRNARFQSAAEFNRALEALSRRAGWPLSVDALAPLLS